MLCRKSSGRKKVIAIDGPAGAGKSTVARLTAKRLDYLYIDTGAIYRTITLKALKERVDSNDTKRLAQIARDLNIDLADDSQGRLKVFLEGEDVTAAIRAPEVNRSVSDVAKVPQVRVALLSLQRSFAEKNNIVLEGRDIGTVVFPDADRKFYIDASFKERVNRRFKEIKDKFSKLTPEEVSTDLSNRDRIDSTRKTAPLKQAENAIYIDTTDMAIEEVVDTVLKKIGEQSQ